MQSAKNAAASVKETAANVAASAKSGMDKTKATVQEKVEKMSAHDPLQKDTATQRKEEKIHQAELGKLEAREQNAASKQAAAVGGTQIYPTGVTGAGHTTTAAGQTGHLTKGVAGAHTGTGTTPVQSTSIGGGPPGYGAGADGHHGPGGAYS